MLTATDEIQVMFCLPCNHYKVERDRIPVLFGRGWSSVLMSYHLPNARFPPLSPFVANSHHISNLTSAFLVVHGSCLCTFPTFSQLGSHIAEPLTGGFHVSHMMTGAILGFLVWSTVFLKCFLILCFFSQKPEFLQYNIEASSDKLLAGDVFQHDRRM